MYAETATADTSDLNVDLNVDLDLNLDVNVAPDRTRDQVPGTRDD